jgi:hypothetical protein
LETIKNLDTNKPTKQKGEPVLYAEPGAAKTFIEDFLEYRSKNEERYTELEWCDRLLRRISQNRREWALLIEGMIGMLKTETFASACFVTIYKNVELLETEEFEKLKANLTKEATKNGDNSGQDKLPNGRRNQEGRRGYQDYQAWQPQGASNQVYQSNAVGGQAQPYQQSHFGNQPPQGYVPNTFGGQQSNALQPNQQIPSFQPGRQPPYPTMGAPPLAGQGYQGNQPGGLADRNRIGLPFKPREPFRCFNCDDPSHSSKECTQPKKCRVCKSPNHLAYNCDGSGPKGTGGPSPQGLGQSTEAANPGGKQYVPVGFNVGPPTVTFAPSASGGGQGNK